MHTEARNLSKNEGGEARREGDHPEQPKWAENDWKDFLRQGKVSKEPEPIQEELSSCERRREGQRQLTAKGNEILKQEERSSEEMGLRRTWEDFELLAYELFDRLLADKLPEYMRKCRLSKRRVICYINWAAGMYEWQIAKALGITRAAVHDHLHSLRLKWPHLFWVGPRLKGSQRLSLRKTIWYDPKKHDYLALRRF